MAFLFSQMLTKCQSENDFFCLSSATDKRIVSQARIIAYLYMNESGRKAMWTQFPSVSAEKESTVKKW